MTKLTSGFLILGVVVSAGCGHHYRVHSIIDTSKPQQAAWQKQDWGNFFTEGFVKRELINPYTYRPPGRESTLYQIATTSDDQDVAKQARNDLQNAIVRVSKAETAKHLARLKSTENKVNLLLGSAQLALSGGASVAAETSAKALAAASTGAGGARALFNEQVYRNTLVESLTTAVSIDQERFYEQSIRSQKDKSISEYGVEEAINDAMEYHKRGSFYYGLGLIRKAIEEQNNSEGEELQKAVENNLR